MTRGCSCYMNFNNNTQCTNQWAANLNYLIDAAIEVLIPLAPTELHSARRTLQHTWKQVKNKSHHSLEFKKKMVFISWWWKFFFTKCVLLFSLRVRRDPDVTIIYDEGDRSPFRGWHLPNKYNCIYLCI